MSHWLDSCLVYFDDEESPTVQLSIRLVIRPTIQSTPWLTLELTVRRYESHWPDGCFVYFYDEEAEHPEKGDLDDCLFRVRLY